MVKVDVPKLKVQTPLLGISGMKYMLIMGSKKHANLKSPT
jgi:hypothetical protein